MAAEQQTGKPGFFYGYVNVVLVFIILTVIWVPVYTYGVFFEPFITAFNWSRTLISGATTLNNLTFGVFCVITARLCEKFNPRLIASTYAILLGLGYFLMSQMNSAWQLYLYYGIVMSFSTSIYIAMLSIVARWFVKRRGLMTGIVFSGLGLAGSLGPLVVNELISLYDWRQCFLILGIASAIIILPTSQFLKRDPQQAGQLPYGASTTEQGTHAIQGLSLHQTVRTRQFWLLAGMYFIFLFCMVMILVHLVIHAIGLGVPPTTAATILAIYGVVSIISVNIMGLSADKFGNRRTFAVNALLMAVSFFWLLTATTTWQLYLFAIILGLAYGGMQVLFSPLVAEIFGLKAHSVILSAVAIGGSIGAALGPLAAGYAFDQTGNYSTIFTLCAVLALGTVALTLLLRPLVKEKHS